MRAADLMTTSVVTIRADQTIKEAADLMLEHRVSALPVLDPQDRLVGIISEGDLIRRGELGTERRRSRLARFFTDAATLAEEYVRSHATRVSDVMTMALVTAKPDAPLADIADLMERHRVRRIPIADKETLIGILSRRDLVRALAGQVPALLAARVTDRMIQDAIYGELGRQPWVNQTNFEIVVTDGTVTLAGALASDAERKAVVVLARNIPGVKMIEDNLIIVPAVPPML